MHRKILTYVDTHPDVELRPLVLAFLKPPHTGLGVWFRSLWPIWNVLQLKETRHLDFRYVEFLDEAGEKDLKIFVDITPRGERRLARHG